MSVLFFYSLINEIIQALITFRLPALCVLFNKLQFSVKAAVIYLMMFLFYMIINVLTGVIDNVMLLGVLFYNCVDNNLMPL